MPPRPARRCQNKIGEPTSRKARKAPSSQSGPFYRVIVSPDNQNVSIYGEERTLPAGMQVHAYALLERRRLYEWALAPLYDIGRATRGL